MERQCQKIFIKLTLNLETSGHNLYFPSRFIWMSNAKTNFAKVNFSNRIQIADQKSFNSTWAIFIDFALWSLRSYKSLIVLTQLNIFFYTIAFKC